jgi:hypothetical protein
MVTPAGALALARGLRADRRSGSTCDLGLQQACAGQLKVIQRA